MGISGQGGFTFEKMKITLEDTPGKERGRCGKQKTMEKCWKEKGKRSISMMFPVKITNSDRIVAVINAKVREIRLRTAKRRK